MLSDHTRQTIIIIANLLNDNQLVNCLVVELILQGKLEQYGTETTPTTDVRYSEQQKTPFNQSRNCQYSLMELISMARHK